MFDPQYAHDAFPACRKLGRHLNSHPVWYTPAVLDYFNRFRICRVLRSVVAHICVKIAESP
jgi:hypothetical protein